MLDTGLAQTEVFFQEQFPDLARSPQVGWDAFRDLAVECLVCVKQQSDTAVVVMIVLPEIKVSARYATAICGIF
jgi:hypothetical protein